MLKNPVVEVKSLPCKLPLDLARKVDALVPTLPKGCGYHAKSNGELQEIKGEERTEISVISSDSKDREGEILFIDGLDSKLYEETNPIVLWQHDAERPVGRNVWLKKDGNKALAKTHFPPKPKGYEGDWLPDQVFALQQAGIVRAKSVGFLNLTPLREPTAPELEKRPDWKDGGIFDKTLLLEYSVVSLGCNQDALMTAITNKSFDPHKIKALGIDLPKRKTISLPPRVTFKQQALLELRKLNSKEILKQIH